MAHEEIKKNIILLGDAAVGKTSLIRRYVLDQFDERYVTTIGSKVTKKEVVIPNGGNSVKMVMMIWDVIGQKDYELTQALSMKNIDGALLVTDVTRPETLDGVGAHWIPNILSVRGQVPIVFLANKSDLAEDAAFDIMDLEEAAMASIHTSAKPACLGTSAKTGENIETAFLVLAGSMLRKMDSPSDSLRITEMIRNSEAKSLAGVVDFIIADFADQYGGIEVATPIVKRQMTLAGLDVSNPNLESVTKFIDNMAKVEASFKPENDVSVNRQARLQKMKDA